MPKCPNCGLETARTEDWACQWCGHPLLRKGYKKIDKTYRQLQEERYPRTPPMKLEPEAEPEIQAEPETAPEPEPVPEAVPAIPPDSEPEPEPAPAPEPAPESEAAPELPPEPSPAPVAEAPPEPTAVSTTEPKLEPDPETGAIAVTVEELNLAFGADKAATNAKLADKTLRVSGRVDKIIVKDYLDIQYILLTSREGTGRWNVRCTFDREHGAKLLRLKAGETVTVQGSYDSCERNIILRDCLLIG